MNNFRNILEALISKTEKCCVLEMQKGIYACIINIESEDCIPRIKEVFEKFEQVFKNDLEYYTVCIGIGESCQDMGKLAASYNQAIIALQNRSKQIPYQIIEFSKLPVKNQVVFTFYDQKKIVNCIKTSNKEGLNQVVSDILNENNNRGISYKNMLELYKQLWSVGQRCLEEQGRKLEDLESINGAHIGFIEPKKESSFEEAKSELLNFLDNVLDYIALEGICSGNKIIDMIQKYVLDNYAEDLSLEHIGSELGISAKYISRVYKQKCGENLTDYINEVRIKKGKEMLLTTNTKIGDIATMVGIESRSTFLRVFKKLEGVSPNEYRSAYAEIQNQNVEKN
jgi:YesN/AraC family two-component response regulator